MLSGHQKVGVHRGGTLTQQVPCIGGPGLRQGTSKGGGTYTTRHYPIWDIK
ncbi:hypothetical protein PCANC_28060 [Puccinia coronata f. sp. avenae]|uniref:Uncharacterized protein n=1 Tax=Puccinia coronata f. sp. avenae TaxID=200324 RepID=A0A2N5TEF4_9BASI|nr:hypothetical protein PCANC_28060 [Puccinia coronata f. sp. avenae]